MLIKVRVQPRAGKQRVERIAEGDGGGGSGGAFKVWLQSAPEGGKANAELVEVVAGFFGVKKSAVRLVSGAKSRNKTVEVAI